MIRDLTERTKRKFIVVNIASEIGITKTAELFNLDRGTIRIWRKRYSANGLEGLQNRSRSGQKFSNKTPDEITNKILELKSEYPDISAKKIKEVLNLNCSLQS